MKNELTSEQKAEVMRRLANPGETVPEAEVKAVFDRFKDQECDACPTPEGGGIEGNIPLTRIRRVIVDNKRSGNRVADLDAANVTALYVKNGSRNRILDGCSDRKTAC